MHARVSTLLTLLISVAAVAGDGFSAARATAGDTPKPAAAAAATVDERVYEVHKRVADYPDREDLSTPEVACATFGRLSVKEASWGPSWRRLSVPELRHLTLQPVRPLPKDRAEILLNGEILEVHLLGTTRAAVIVQRKDFDHDNQVWDLQWVRRIDGRWLNEGCDRAMNLDEARQKARTPPTLPPDPGIWYFLTREFWIRAIVGQMHNPFVLSFADGTAFFAAITTVLVAILLLLWVRRRLAAGLLIAVALLGVVAVILSATPMPLWAYAIWLVAATASLLLCRCRPTHKARLAATGVLLVMSIGLCAAEVPHYLFPRVSVRPGATIYVLGDSLSAGKDPSLPERCWPAVLGDMTHLTVVNLAQPGARLRHAMSQAKRITEGDSPVILEIGANDALEDGPQPAKFREQLDALVGSLQGHRPLLMFEIPLFPLQNAYGQVQREVAAKYGVMLIPKRCFTSVWCLDGGTLDKIHFSQAGHNAIARMIVDVLQVEDGTAAPKANEAADSPQPDEGAR